MVVIGDALALIMLSPFSLPQYSAYDLLYLNISDMAGDLLDKAADAIIGNSNVRAVCRQLHAAINILNADTIEKAILNVKGLLMIAIAAAINGIKIIIAMHAYYFPQAERHWQIQSFQSQAALIFGIIALAALSLSRTGLLSIIFREDWSRYSSDVEIKERCVEPLLKNLKIKYISARPCKFRQGDATHEGEIDFFLYDDIGPIAIIKDKATIENDEDLKNTRELARSYCLGLYIFENIAVNCFVIASKEGLKIYQIKHSEDHLTLNVSPGKLNRSRKRWIKEKLLEIR